MIGRTAVQCVSPWTEKTPLRRANAERMT